MVLLIGLFWIMGRTVPTWRNRIEAELAYLDNYRRALSSFDKSELDLLLMGVRKRRTAGGMLPAHDAWKPMLISMLLECSSRIKNLEKQIEQLTKEE